MRSWIFTLGSSYDGVLSSTRACLLLFFLFFFSTVWWVHVLINGGGFLDLVQDSLDAHVDSTNSRLQVAPDPETISGSEALA